MKVNPAVLSPPAAGTETIIGPGIDIEVVGRELPIGGRDRDVAGADEAEGTDDGTGAGVELAGGAAPARAPVWMARALLALTLPWN